MPELPDHRLADARANLLTRFGRQRDDVLGSADFGEEKPPEPFGPQLKVAATPQYGSSLLKPEKRSAAVTLLLSQFKSPIILILLFATGLSFFLHDHVNALIILVIVLRSGLIGFRQERDAADTVEKLLAIGQIMAPAVRDGKSRSSCKEQSCSFTLFQQNC